MLAAAAHAVHALLVSAGAAVVAWLLWRTGGRRRDAVRDLRSAARSGRVLEQALARARADLGGIPDTGQRSVFAAADRTGLAAVAAAASLAAAAVHIAVGPEHLSVSAVTGGFFFAVAAWQVGWAIRVAGRPCAAT